MMKISFLMGIYPSYGGVEKVTTHLANEFVRRGHKVSIVSFNQPHPYIAERELDKRVRLLPLRFPVWSKDNLVRIREFYANDGLDILISQWAVPAKVAWFCKKAISGTNAKLITVHHNLPDTNTVIKSIEIKIAHHEGNQLINRLKLWGIREFSRWNLRQVYKVSDKFVILSERLKPIASKFMRLPMTSNIYAITNPLTISPPHKIIPKEKTIIYVGRIENNQKRTMRLLDIWESLYEKLPEWDFKIVGDGPDRKALEDEIVRRKLKRIKLMGYADPEPFFSRAKILLLVSEYEGFGLVISEGMSYGVVPIVLDSFPSCRDTITDSSVGVIVEYPFDVKIFSDKVLSLALDDKRWAEMSVNAVKNSQRFSITAIADQWESLFSECSDN